LSSQLPVASSVFRRIVPRMADASSLRQTAEVVTPGPGTCRRGGQYHAHVSTTLAGRSHWGSRMRKLTIGSRRNAGREAASGDRRGSVRRSGERRSAPFGAAKRRAEIGAVRCGVSTAGVVGGGEIGCGAGQSGCQARAIGPVALYGRLAQIRSPPWSPSA